MAASKVAVVTGANKGIGYAIVRGLCKKFNGDVILTSRDEGRGKEAIEKLRKEGLNPKFHQLAVDDEASIKNLKDFLEKEYGGIDVLVNNAGIAYSAASTASVQEQAENTVGINYCATRKVCQILFPLLRKHARVVNVSSAAGSVAYIQNDELKMKFMNPNLSDSQLEELVQSYLNDVKAGMHKENGWAATTYQMSKIALTALSFVQHRMFAEKTEMDIVVNACHPGYVDTDMTNHKGTKHIDEGASSSIYLSLLPPNVKTPRGEFIWEDCTVADWSKK